MENDLLCIAQEALHNTAGREYYVVATRSEKQKRQKEKAESISTPINY